MTTITLNDQSAALLVKLLSQLATKQPKAATKSAKPTNVVNLTDRQAAFQAAVVATFAKKGVKVTPNVDVFTHKLWAAKGFTVTSGPGSATFVKTKGMNGRGIPMFHRGQVTKS